MTIIIAARKAFYKFLRYRCTWYSCTCIHGILTNHIAVFSHTPSLASSSLGSLTGVVTPSIGVRRHCQWPHPFLGFHGYHGCQRIPHSCCCLGRDGPNLVGTGDCGLTVRVERCGCEGVRV